MFVAWRDLRFARGRFLLIASVVTLITLLVGFLSGLTAGLASQNVSAVMDLDADRIVFSQPAQGKAPSYDDSTLTPAQEKAWANQPGVETVEPLGISQGKATGSQPASVALFGIHSGAGDAPKAGTVALSEPAAESLGAKIGDTVRIGDSSYTATRIAGEDWYSHTPVIRMNLSDWRQHVGTPDEPAFATVLLVHGETSGDVSGTVSTSVLGSLTAIGAFSSEIGSLLMMVGMLFAISALVIGSFFTVWTIQRRGDIAVLKALGASTRMLTLDALGQALLVLVSGVGLGIALTAGLGALAGTALPFVLSPFTTAAPAAVMIALGLAGAAFALRSVTTTDPLTALGSNR